MKLFFILTKKSLAVILALLVAFFAAFAWLSSLKASAVDGGTHAKRMEYISSLKIEVDEENFTQKETVIPKDFGQVYAEYNKLQKSAGFNLESFKGKSVTVYSYPIKNAERNLTLIIYKDEIIGGDIADTEINGKMLPIGKY